MFNIKFHAASQGWLPGCVSWDNGKCLGLDLSFKSSHTNRKIKQDKGCSDLTNQLCWPFSSPSAHSFRAPIKGIYLVYKDGGDSHHSSHGCSL